MIITVDYASVDGNDPPDWAAAKAACHRDGSTLGGVFFRGAYGTLPDLTVGRDWRRAQDAGLVTGAYLFLRNVRGQPPVDQVHAFANAVGALTANDFVPVIDVEDSWPSPQDELEALGEAWDAMVEIYGVPPMIYDSNRVWVEDLHNMAAGKMTRSPQWTAKPWPWPVRHPAQLSPAPFAGTAYDPVVPAPWGPGNWWLHQFQGDARPMPGFSNTVDLSRFYLMTEGETGPRVSEVQSRLGWPTSGVFDADMTGRVRALQKFHGLAVDGVIGPNTFTRIFWTPPPRE